MTKVQKVIALVGAGISLVTIGVMYILMCKEKSEEKVQVGITLTTNFYN